MKSLLNKLNSFDKLIILFCIITGIYISLGFNLLENIFVHISLRLIFIIIIVLLVSFSKPNNKFLFFIRNFYPLLLLGFFYGETDYYNNLIFENLDPYLVKIEDFVFGNQLSITFSERLPFKWFSETMHFGYFSYYLFTFGVPLLFYLRKKDQFEKALFVIIFSFCIFYLLFTIFPSIGPQFYFSPEQTNVPNGYVFDKIMHVITKYGETETGAFPSSHVGLTVIFLILCWKHFRRYFIILTIPASLLIFSTVYIKAHYAIDIIAGALFGFILYYLSASIFKVINK